MVQKQSYPLTIVDQFMIKPSQLHRIRIELVNIACIKECFRAWNRRRRPVPRHFSGLWLSRRSLGGLPRRLPACSALPDVPKLHTSLAFLAQVIAHHMLHDLLVGRSVFRLHKEEGAGPLGGAPFFGRFILPTRSIFVPSIGV
jgi:hypothetical protein